MLVIYMRRSHRGAGAPCCVRRCAVLAPDMAMGRRIAAPSCSTIDYVDVHPTMRTQRTTMSTLQHRLKRARHAII